jgi:hypothetical protein
MMGGDDAVVVDVATVAFIVWLVPTMDEDAVVIHNAAVVDDRRCDDRRDKKDDDDDDENVVVGDKNDQTGWYEHCVHSSNSITFVPTNRWLTFILQYMLYLPNRYVSIRTIEVE